MREHRGAKGAVWCEVGYGEGCPLSSRLRIWWSVVSSPSRVRGRVPTAVAFSAYFRPQNASGSKKNTVLTVAALCVKLQYCETQNCLKNCKLHFEKVLVTCHHHFQKRW